MTLLLTACIFCALFIYCLILGLLMDSAARHRAQARAFNESLRAGLQRLSED